MNMTTPFLSIVIPVYNGLSNDLSKCLDSIWGQSLPKELYEVICIDDCSTDDTRSWLKEQQKKHSNLVVIENEKNIRQGGSRNKGVRAAKGKYIVCTGTHTVCVINGSYYDSWDSGNEPIIFYYSEV